MRKGVRFTAMNRVPSRRRFVQWTAAASLGALAGARVMTGEARQSISAAGNTYVDARRVLLWENTRREFREALEGGTLKAMIVPTGSTEQHNEHLAMIQDTASVTLVAHQSEGPAEHSGSQVGATGGTVRARCQAGEHREG
jgi:hypothetical protein